MYYFLTVNNNIFYPGHLKYPTFFSPKIIIFFQNILSSGKKSKWSDDQCMKKMVSGSDEPFQVLFDRYGELIFGYCMKLLKDKERAEDASQEVWVKVIKNCKKYQGQGKFRAWVLQVARNTCFTVFRELKKNFAEDVSQHEVEDVSQQNILDLMDDKQDKNHLKDCINKLSENQRLVLIIWMTEEKSYEEIAKEMKISVSSVKSLLFRSRQKLKEMMAG